MPRSIVALLLLGVLTGSVCGFQADKKAEKKAAKKAAAKKEPAYISVADAGPEFYVQGEYEGTIGEKLKMGAQVIALGDAKFSAVLFAKGLPGAGWDGKTDVPLKGETMGGVTTFVGTNFNGKIQNAVFTGVSEAGVTFELKRVERQSPTVGAKPPAGAIVLFDGTNTDEWVDGKIEEGNLLGVGTRTKRSFKDFTLHLEFRTPYTPTGRGQQRGNSGMYLNDQYECQVLDSFGLSGENNECGGFYTIAKPKVNMCLPPLSWQTYDVEFAMARFDAAGKKTKGAVATVKHNGVVIHENLELPRITQGGGNPDESKSAPLFLQDHGDPVRFRNIWIVEKN